ncbi:phosphotransferase [Mesobacterium sp. TK19101]|uniref:Phosphotransferase n=1 Tax=Mesobacterium hydrothermale TaxID=3111907 RepID=A0ABU6HGL9_9RHOB|nr:phosphotransferase [Mesobacterium sp. TK19101]MEC3861598.1 phosphotransferase [Mesobacterium sp. TK19101]
MTPDASSRTYTRLCKGEDTAVVMQDPDGDVALFARLSRHLSALGLSAPRIIAEAPQDGLLLIEDLGDDLFARLCETDPALEPTLYDTAVDVLIALHRAKPPAGLTVATPSLLAQMIDPAFDFYAARAGQTPSQTDRRALQAALKDALDSHASVADVMILRDYHAENLLWLPQRTGTACAGLLDFQDALIGHRAYDLVSLLQDARRDVTGPVTDRAIRRFADRTGTPEDTLRAACAVLGVQRNLRILGIFARLAVLRGKPGYLGLIPRVWGHIDRSLHHPALSSVAPLIAKYLPAPTPDVLERLAR